MKDTRILMLCRLIVEGRVPGQSSGNLAEGYGNHAGLTQHSSLHIGSVRWLNRI